jgi:hypothetical protein
LVVRPILIHVVDAISGQPVGEASFAVAGADESAYCPDRAITDGGSACVDGWVLDLLAHHDITVSSPGHVDQTVTVDTGVTQTNCCGSFPGHTVELTVQLQQN